MVNPTPWYIWPNPHRECFSFFLFFSSRPFPRSYIRWTDGRVSGELTEGAADRVEIFWLEDNFTRRCSFSYIRSFLTVKVACYCQERSLILSIPNYLYARDLSKMGCLAPYPSFKREANIRSLNARSCFPFVHLMTQAIRKSKRRRAGKTQSLGLWISPTAQVVTTLSPSDIVWLSASTVVITSYSWCKGGPKDFVLFDLGQ